MGRPIVRVVEQYKEKGKEIFNKEGYHKYADIKIKVLYTITGNNDTTLLLVHGS